MTSSGALILLSDDGSLRQLSPRQDHVEMLVPQFGPFSPVDLLSGNLAGEERLIVLAYLRRGGQPSLSRLSSFTTSGEPRETWSLPLGEAFSSLALDSERSVAYVTKGNASEIYRVPLDQTKPGSLRPTFIASARHAQALGAIALDSLRQQLFVAAPYDGQILALDLASREVRTLVNKVGDVFSLAFDARHRQLYAADSSSGRIWKVETSAQVPRAVLFLEQPALREPMGLALSQDGSLWVAYKWEGVLLQVSPEGQVLRRIGP